MGSVESEVKRNFFWRYFRSILLATLTPVFVLGVLVLGFVNYYLEQNIIKTSEYINTQTAQMYNISSIPWILSIWLSMPTSVC